MKVYGIDYGTVSTGIARGDSILKIATGIGKIKTPEIFNFFLKEGLTDNNIVALGLPVSMSSRFSEQTFKTVDFALKLKEKFGVKIYLIDERLTTSMVYSTMKNVRSTKEYKNSKDENSSVLILSSFFSNEKGYSELIPGKVFDIGIVEKDNLMVYNTAVSVSSLKGKAVDIFTTDPWIFWYYFKNGFKSTTIEADLKVSYESIYTFMVEEKYLKEKFLCECVCSLDG
ncbi:MAG TPA: Holliday junction resolvase RuvX [Petrotogaceae bacterium]|nr:Holliday junction resolvase RuvX [Petrotogaceae bacterium]